MLIDNVPSGSASDAGSAVANIAGRWLALALRTGWIGRHVVGRAIDLDDVRDWVSVMPGRSPLAVSCLLGEAARSPERAGRVAAAVASREWMSLPRLDHSAQLVELTPLLARQLLLLVLAPSARQ